MSFTKQNVCFHAALIMQKNLVAMRLTHVELLVVVKSLLLGNHIPYASQPVRHEREANLLSNKSLR